MNVPRYAALAAKLLARHASKNVAASGDRARGVATVEHAIRQSAARRRTRFSAAALASAAACALAWYGVQSRQAPNELAAPAPLSISVLVTGGEAKLRSLDREQVLQGAATVSAGQAVQTAPQGGAKLRLSTGTELQLAADTGLRVDSAGATERFSLTRGTLSAHVAKLLVGQRFIVETPDAEIEVRGTRFLLTVLGPSEVCSNGSHTRLEVSEGLVELRRGGVVAASVAAGQTWPAACLAPVAARATETKLAVNPSDERAGTLPSPPTHSTSPQASPLTRQNDLFAQGVALRREGDVGAALRAYQQLISQFPSSPLAENAAVERVRLLATSQPTRAREEARAYLKRYPRGFAVDELGRIADER